MKQYMEVKRQYPKHILLYRIGDFYEMFFDDAQIVSRELQLVLTGKDCGLDERAPMCGIPHHAAEVYIKKLVDKNYMVAVCEQTEDPSKAKGLVKREVVRVLTPGTITDGNLLDEGSNNYICSFYARADECALCFADVSTGEARLYSFAGKDMSDRAISELSRYMPSELLINEGFLTLKQVNSFVRSTLKTTVQLMDEADFLPEVHADETAKQFSAESIEDLGVNALSVDAYALCGLFGYIHQTQLALVNRFTSLIKDDGESMMTIGFTARRNLELTETLRGKEKKGSLLWVLDKTKTSMGRRLLKKYLEQPLTNPSAIIDRLDAVEALTNNPVTLGEITAQLSSVYDLERLMTRVMYKTAGPRDLKSLSLTALKLPELKRLMEDVPCRLIQQLNRKMSTLEPISNLVENSLVDDPPALLKDGGVIRDGYNEELDGLRNIISGGKDIIEDIEKREREKTGIKTLKVGYNRVFGYYIEVTRSNLGLVPDRYIKKQTLKNCERYITEELKVAENTILGASEKVVNLEADIFNEIRNAVSAWLELVQATAQSVAALDVLCSFASISVANGYSKPEIAIDGIIDIRNGRHPVVELMQTEEVFVPNDTYLDLTDNRMIIITGPNMSGKSTYMRQTALITLMAQIGCFVPADYAKISVVDQIFTRIGASDDLTSGQSTFMVEMSEVADIVKHATRQSLVILDEVGRGTSTYDGISIARSVCEYICSSKGLGCKTLFATHYHELIDLEGQIRGVKNYSIAVKRKGSDIRFLRKIVEGGADDSFGIEVAKLAGLPNRIIVRAKELLTEMEKESCRDKAAVKAASDQISFSAINDAVIKDKLRETNVDEMDDTELREFVEDLMKYL
ncbi:MAG: DNA mismatch repair protein MutS [Ruminococcus sp.]|nr:DNA mismatch repair protein MutS [Ruminococcus sp.]